MELGEWTSEREREAAKLEHKGDDIAACFLLEQALLDGGYEQIFAGEVTGLIGAGAFVAFGPGVEESSGGGDGDLRGRARGAPIPIYEGMLPVRLMRSEEGATGGS